MCPERKRFKTEFKKRTVENCWVNQTLIIQYSNIQHSKKIGLKYSTTSIFFSSGNDSKKQRGFLNFNRLRTSQATPWNGPYSLYKDFYACLHENTKNLGLPSTNL